MHLVLFKAMRPAMALASMLLAIASFSIQPAQHGSVLVVIFLTPILVSATMVWNDYVDRRIDILKGKYDAWRNPAYYLIFALSLFGIVVSGSLSLLEYEPRATLLMLGLVVVCMLYSLTRKIPCLSSLTVAICSSSLVVFSFFSQHVRWNEGLVLLSLAFLVIMAREIIKDLNDQEADLGYKSTIPLLLGPSSAKKTGALMLFASSLLVLMLSVSYLTMVGMAFLLYSGLILLLGQNEGPKFFLNLGMFCSLLGLILS